MNMYNVSNNTLSQSVIGVLAEFQSNGGFLSSDLLVQQAANNQHENDVTKIFGGNVGVDIESVLDVQMMSQSRKRYGTLVLGHSLLVICFCRRFF